MDDGAEGDISNITIDTSVAGDHVITYRATDETGNVGEATRTVHVVDSTSSPQVEGESEPIPIPEPEPTPATATPPRTPPPPPHRE